MSEFFNAIMISVNVIKLRFFWNHFNKKYDSGLFYRSVSSDPICNHDQTLHLRRRIASSPLKSRKRVTTLCAFFY